MSNIVAFWIYMGVIGILLCAFALASIADTLRGIRRILKDRQ